MMEKRYRSLKLNTKFTLIITILVLITIVSFSAVLLGYNRKMLLKENSLNVENLLEQEHSLIQKQVESITIAAQFVMGDEELVSILNSIKRGQEIPVIELMDFLNVILLLWNE